jgi:HEAT repeat protein
MEAASALSYIQDPLAVASLVRVLQNGSLVEHYAVDGLGRIGGPEAIAALLAAQDHPDEEVRAAVRLMLGMI